MRHDKHRVENLDIQVCEGPLCRVRNCPSPRATTSLVRAHQVFQGRAQKPVCPFWNEVLHLYGGVAWQSSFEPKYPSYPNTRLLPITPRCRLAERSIVEVAGAIRIWLSLPSIKSDHFVFCWPRRLFQAVQQACCSIGLYLHA